MRYLFPMVALAFSLGACAPTKVPQPAPPPPSAAIPSTPQASVPPSPEPAPLPGREEPSPSALRLAAALLGAEGVRALNEADRQAMELAAKNALDNAPTGRGAPWRNPATGNSGTITPVRSFRDARRHYCRDYQQTTIAAGQTRQSKGTACRREDGSWQVVQ